ncbi:unnamed protein product [Caenorhabditis angaria]|uniref:Potassium channel domain-containing protein n=1 Tax=Caenorhabditis angaria TaxID=860376 RepID=A0A9P1N3F6_9PELO|nr:unnamed protein product [Caenorhabditis angaria]
MFLVESLKTSLEGVSTAFVHFALIVGVAIYTVFGALSMQYLESPERIRSHMKREIPDRVERIFLGEELSEMDPNVHKCLEQTINAILARDNCAENLDLSKIDIEQIDNCYLKADIPPRNIEMVKKEKNKIEEEKPAEIENQEPPEKWSIGNSVIFAFTVITTIGYGHIAPETFEGRLFCIFYGLIGVPFTLLTIADLGMFLTKILRSVLTLSKKSADFLLSKFSKNTSARSTKSCEKDKKSIEKNEEKIEEEEEAEPEEKEESEPRKTEESVALGITFACYLLAGAKILSVYEPEMNFFNALYFNFVTLTTIGLGDFVPKSFDYLFITLVYIGIGLALTTMAIEIAADLLKKIHYAGRKMENVASAVVWFGGKKLVFGKILFFL